jgi:hypothetical protein
MDDKALRSWVSDQLFALLGFAENSLASFIVALGAFLEQPFSASLRLRPSTVSSLYIPDTRTPAALLRCLTAKKATHAGALGAQLVEQVCVSQQQSPVGQSHLHCVCGRCLSPPVLCV